MKPLKIYLGDLTYDTLSLSTEAFPLNIGLIASYCIKKFGNDVEIKLFKYINDLDKAINESPPDVLGLSNYAWCHRVSLEMFRILNSVNPNAITIWGGPNFPQDIISQEKFLKKFPEVDIYVPIEGEIGFSNTISRILKSNSTDNMKNTISGDPIDGCINRSDDGKIQYGNPTYRLEKLDDVPSPYLSGLLDQFFDGRLSPMMQTNRGCPFSCSYCVDGADIVKKVNKFSLDRIKDEINYIAEHVPESTTSMFISDLNFGMIPRDLEICDMIADTQKKFGYPKQIQATTGKNSKERIINAIKRTNGALRIWMSVQSMDQDVLKNIRRDNISVDQIIALAPTIKEANLPTTSELILALPGETYQSHVNSIRDMVKAQMDDIQVYTCMMLHGAELNTPKQREKWGLKTKFRLLPRDFAKLSNNKNVVEIEEVIISTNTLTFEEYVELRVLALVLWSTSVSVAYEPILKLLREKNMDVFELFYRSLKKIKNSSQQIQKIINSYKQETQSELWDSSEELETHFNQKENYDKLLSGEAGTNLIQTHQALILEQCMDEWTEYILDISKEIFQENNQFTGNMLQEFTDVSNYCRGLSHNILGKNRFTTNPTYQFSHDITSWLKNNNDLKLEKFYHAFYSKIEFKISEEQFKVVEDKIEIFGSSSIGMAQVIKRIPRKMLCRIPVELNKEQSFVNVQNDWQRSMSNP
jgi:radical SAM superfamily enzyme YgiQ (UPF0313 family)